MKIYLVFEDWFEQYSIRECFSSLEKAETYIKETGLPKINFRIIEMDLK